MPQKEIRTLKVENIEVRNDGEGSEKRVLEGYAAIFGSWSEDLGGFREMIRAGAFSETLASDSDVYLLADHSPTTVNVLARRNNGSLQISEDERGLKISATLPDTQNARDIYANIENGNVNSMSFGFSVREDAWNYDDEDTVERELISVDLVEVSVVPFPAYRATTVDARAVEKAKELRKQSQSITTPLSAESANLRRKAFLITNKIGVNNG